MTGPEHFAEATRLLATTVGNPQLDMDGIAMITAQAQVHATLALVSATVGEISGRSDWRDVMQPAPPDEHDE